MSYQVLYRTYRPSKFSEVVGQEYIVKILKNTIKNQKIAHAYLFAGPRGTGKTTIAKLFAKAINCENFNEESCDECASCLAFKENNHPDIIELDAASNNRVEDIREIIDQVPYAPIISKYKVYIIDEVHMLSSSAFNALLKTLEEPPAHVVFILATTDPQKIIPTVLSRCQRYNFSKISNLNMKKKMMEILDKENLKYEEKALEEVAMLAEGGMRDALSILEQVLSYNNEGVYLEDIQKIFGLSTKEEKVKLLIDAHKNITSAINSLREMYNYGIDPKRLCIDLLEIIKEALIYSDDQNATLLSKIDKFDAMNILEAININDLLNDITYLEEALSKTRSNQNFLTYLELALVKMGGAKVKDSYKEPIKEEKKALEETIVEQQPIQEEPLIEETVLEDSLNLSNIESKEEVREPIENRSNSEVTEIKEESPERIIKDSTTMDATIKDSNPSAGPTIEYLAALLLTASKNYKESDSIIYNRMELFMLDPNKRKFYELLKNTSLFASGKDVIIVTGPKLAIDNINATENKNELYRFIMEEFGLDKVIYGVDDAKCNDLIAEYKKLVAAQNNFIPNVEKPTIKKELTNEEKVKELFVNARIEN